MTSNIPFKLKDVYTPELVKSYAALIRQIHPSFPAEGFSKKIFSRKWKDLELKERMRHISDQLNHHLPGPYKKSVSIVVKSIDHLLKLYGEKMAFEYGFVPDFVERFGIHEPDVSIPALEKITQWTSAEFAIRPFILKYPDRMYEQMLTWADHKSPNVRRLASEGFRPRLPWGMGIPMLKKDPSPILSVLEKLKQDPSETVRRSVANNLNDISKDHPEMFLEIIIRWQGKNSETDWVIRHASRGLLKRGHATVLSLFGFDQHQSTLNIDHFTFSKKVTRESKLEFSFRISNTSNKPVNARIEYAIDYITSTGKNSRKVFQIREKELVPNSQEMISRFQRFIDLTTRKHYAGKHRIAILINGKEMAEGFFILSI